MTAPFVYTLRAALEKQQWQVEKLQRVLGEAQAALNQLQARRNDIHAMIQVQSDQVRQAMLKAIDAPAQQQGLTFLVQLRTRLAKLQVEINAAEKERSEALAALTRAHARKTALEKHRSTMRKEHGIELERREQIDMDHHWSTLSAWRASVEGEPLC
jgi:flagellar biosynthesis chaperone FliJ